LGDLDRRHASIDANGSLFISVGPIPDSVALNAQTGEALNTSAATRTGPAARPDPVRQTEKTECDAETCHALAFGTILAPLDGTLICAHGALNLRSAQLTIQFVIRGSGGAPQPCTGAAVASQVTRGTPILTADNGVVITGIALDGHALGAAVAGDNSLYIGDIRPTVGCPCASGSFEQ
ncbi:MAG TPA: hypothetical protein VN697_05600, partial [Tepidiformaceae bacterium]|nr:hypothetical protein [Tepidiformaceae bacterium]